MFALIVARVLPITVSLPDTHKPFYLSRRGVGGASPAPQSSQLLFISESNILAKRLGS